MAGSEWTSTARGFLLVFWPRDVFAGGIRNEIGFDNRARPELLPSPGWSGSRVLVLPHQYTSVGSGPRRALLRVCRSFEPCAVRNRRVAGVFGSFHHVQSLLLCSVGADRTRIPLPTADCCERS